ncbi:RNA polymerase sporulation sigma factor SigK [Novisyntrophococcus fermenticellae]|uniref:RNA polymerase sporulation sigma factor SigK n=1 Tax=Novisyntrophococcus fermenticellae TaxID=2068655 RepID=UPI001E2BD253|nr:RNA polymerase sporulation sigma factor SigK [Novisyntrophococcus fermenticellae]
MKTFQKPLSAQEEKAFLKKYQEGDLDAKNVLIERNMRLVAHVVKKYQGIAEDQEDLISIGTIGLIKAVSTFDHNKSSKLASYAVRCIENEILMFLRSRKKLNKEVSLYESIGTDKEGNEIHLMDVMEGDAEDTEEQYLHKENVRKLYNLVEQVLTEQEYKVLCMRYGLYGTEGLTQRAIAGKMGISRSYVSRIEKNAVIKLRNYFE